MFYLSIVRILNGVKKFDERALNNLRNHLNKAQVPFEWIMTYEISPKNLLHHIHCMAVFTDEYDAIQMMNYVQVHRLKQYVDRVNTICTMPGVYGFLYYMHKEITEKAVLCKNLMRSKNNAIFDWHDKFGHKIPRTAENIYMNLNSIPKNMISDDPFIDSEDDSDTNYNIKIMIPK